MSFKFLLLFALILLTPLISANTFGYNYLDNEITTGDGDTYINETNIYQNVTQNITNNITETLELNSTQFETGEPVTIKTSWLTSFTEDISKWTNYFTKTESDLRYIQTESDPVWTADKVNYSTTEEIIAFGYYNASNFVITDYFTKTEILDFSYYNSSDFDINDYFTSAEVLAFNYYNSTSFDINDYVTLTTLLGFDYYNSTDFVITDYYTKLEVYNQSEIDAMIPDLSNYYSKEDIEGFNYINEITAGSNVTITGTEHSRTFEINITSLKEYFDTIYSTFTGTWESLTGKPTLLSNFTDDLGDRGYTHLSNFTNDGEFTTNSSALAYVNSTGLIINWSEEIGEDGNSSFNQSLTDSLYSPISEPLWASNYSAYNESWSVDTDTTYTAGTNLSLVGTEFSLDVSGVQAWLESLFVKLTDLVGLVGNWSADKSNYYNSTEINANISNAVNSLDNASIIRESNTTWITDNQNNYVDSWINETFYNKTQVYNQTEIDNFNLIKNYIATQDLNLSGFDLNNISSINRIVQDADFNITINDGGTERTAIQIHGTEGSVSFPRQSYVLVYKGNNQQAVADTTLTQIQDWTINSADTLSEFNDTTGVFTAKTAGLYLVNALVLWESTDAGKWYSTYISKNEEVTSSGSLRFYQNSAGAFAYQAHSISGVLDLAVGDTLRLYGYHNAGVTEYIHRLAYTSLEIIKIA